jgi:hypothetical protein
MSRFLSMRSCSIGVCARPPHAALRSGSFESALRRVGSCGLTLKDGDEGTRSS